MRLNAANTQAHKPVSLRDAISATEREMLADALSKSNGNISKTAKLLGISRPTLYDLITRYGLQTADKQ
jgi:two-component system NtrC family response regulator